MKDKIPIKFEEHILSECGCVDEIIGYKPDYYEDGELNGYMLSFASGRCLDIDRDELTEEQIKWLVKNKVTIRINFQMKIWKGDIK